MAAKDIYHNNVRNALIKDGWTITHDPLPLQWGRKDFFVDLGAEKLIAATKADQKIAVEVKSFVSRSEIDDLKNALGQFILYFDVLGQLEPDRVLYFAIRKVVFEDLFEEPIGQLLLKNQRMRLLIFESDLEEIVQWIPNLT